MAEKGTREINFIIRNLLKPILKNYSPVILILIRNWNSIMGEKYFEFCEPEKVTFQKNRKNEGKLYVKCFNNVISFYIENNKYFILEKINSIFGYNLISDIKIKQDPRIVKKLNSKEKKVEVKDLEKIETAIGCVENSELKDTLEKLGNSIFSKYN